MAEQSMTTARSTPSGRRNLLFLVPILVFAGVAIVFAIGLKRDPIIVPSALIGKPAPDFSLPPVKGRTLGLTTADLKGQVSLVNVFASWCVECRAEHPLLMRLASERTVPLYGLNYKDKPDDAANWLESMGDPYARTGADLDGRIAIDFVVYGVPETIVIDREGRIAYKQIGPITPKVLDETILPLVERLRQ